jgi:glucosamine kinase
MAYFLGIDGGGTKTRCVLGDETTVLATAMSGGSNVVRLGVQQAREAIHSVIRQACAAAAIVPAQIKAVCIGAAGAARPEIVGQVRNILIEILPDLRSENIEVTGDAEIALESAFGFGPGAIVIAGTGSIAYGRDTTGKIVRAGGWGFAISDEGSGHWIGRRAVAAILTALDRLEETALTSHVLREWKLQTLDELVQAANATPPPNFPQLFPIVLRAAEASDPIAHRLLINAGKELAALATIVLQRLAPGKNHFPVATTGSVFRQSQVVREVFHQELQTTFRDIEVRQDTVNPVDGALARARRLGTSQGTLR